MGASTRTTNKSVTQSAAAPARTTNPAEPKISPQPPPHAPAGRPASDGAVAWLTIRGAAHNNLKSIDVRFPLGRFTCVTGVSGSGKSSLVNDILFNELARRLNNATAVESGRHAGVMGLENLDKIIAIDQTPIGRTPRSNPATYIKLFDEIRDLFTRLPDAKLRGYKPGRFSFNVAGGSRGGGRCEACEGNGANKIEMDFLADVWVTCPVCSGRRFGRETLQIQFKGRSIADVLEMDVATALTHFESQPRIHAMLQTLHDVGLDYLKLGQSSTTLSGGEAQRIKLARELVKKGTGRTLYVLDEPTTGLHFEDIRKLLAVLHGFVDAGNTVVVIEHNLDVIKTADWLIDLGPEGGAGGGQIVAEGTPEDVATVAASHTGAALRTLFSGAAGGAAGPIAAGDGEAAGHPSQNRRDAATHAAPRGPAGLPELITVRGARQHNLKDVSVSFPRDALTVCTGVSGSGKTSFAIDTVFTEGYRRYVESLSAYARQFLGQLQKPKVEHVEGLSPAICIEQKAASKSPRSTVGTITEVYDYLRVLYARVGQRCCPRCNVPIGTQTAEEIVNRVMALPEGAPVILLAPVTLGDNESYAAMFNRLKASGYTRVRIDGDIQLTTHATTLDPRRKHRVEVVIDRTVVRAKARSRINESIEHALALGNGIMTLVIEAVERVHERDEGAVSAAASKRASDEGNQVITELPESVERAGHAAAHNDADESDASFAPNSSNTAQSENLSSPSSLRRSVTASHQTPTDSPLHAPSAESPAPPPSAGEILFSQKLACGRCGMSYEELGPNHFSFNSPLGWCQTCEGLGVQHGAPPESIMQNPEESLLGGAIDGWEFIDPRSPFAHMLDAVCKHIGVSMKTPLQHWTPAQKNALLFGLPGIWLEAPAVHKELGTLRFAWRGIFPTLDSAARNSWSLRARLQTNITEIPCLSCRGGRVRPDAAAVRLIEERAAPGAHSRDVDSAGPRSDTAAAHSSAALETADAPTIVELCERPLSEVTAYFAALRLSAHQRKIAGELLKEIEQRLRFLIDVGLDYLTLHRAAPTLSGGEAQRIRLASQIGSGLSGVLYVLDEPTIGLHPRDNQRLIDALLKLRALGNTLLIVEHDRDVIRRADRILDFGPRAGAFGGRIVADDTPAALTLTTPSASAAAPERADAGDPHDQAESLTRAYLTGAAAIPIPTQRRPVRALLEQAAAPEPRFEPIDEEIALRRRRAPKSARDSRSGADRTTPPGAAVSAASANQPELAALVIRSARQNNLRALDVAIPLGRFVAVTGVSGSGKSSLINDILWPVLANALQRASLPVGDHSGIVIIDDPVLLRRLLTPIPANRGPAKLASRRDDAVDRAADPHASDEIILLRDESSWLGTSGRRQLQRRIDKALNVDQSPLGATPLSNPATYTGVFEQIRELFTRLPDSKVRGYNANRFSFNRPGGRCEACEGYGQKRVEMHFMPDIWVECETCRGQRYNPETLQVRYKGKNISEILDLRVAEALALFDNVPRVRRLLQTLSDVGLGYVQLGQPAPTLSGGEAQRVKLAAELGKPDTGQTLYVLDEPTTGLHFEDVRRLLGVLQRLVDLGNSVVIVEHNLDVLKCADWIIDLGPEAGAGGGALVAQGTPEEIATVAQSHTGRSLAPVLAADPRAARVALRREEYIAQQLADEKAGLGGVGRDIKMPWQIDGRKWHLEQRTSREGKRVRWQPEALVWLLDEIQALGRAAAERGHAPLAPTNWNDRASVEITAFGAPMWFLHVLTGDEWLLELYFRAPFGAFNPSALRKQIQLKTLDEREDIAAYGNWSRVDVRPRLDGWDAIVIYAHDRAELDTPGFRRFLRDALSAYHEGCAMRS